MSRFYLPPESWVHETLSLPNDEAHHCLHVLRHQCGDPLVVFDGCGREADALLVSLSKNAATVRIVQSRLSPVPRCHLMLAQAIPKGKNMDLIIQKAVELGISTIFPLLTERTVVQIEPSALASKQKKWQQLALEACKQCGQNWLPLVEEPKSLELFLQSLKSQSDLLLIGSLGKNTRSLKDVLADFANQHQAHRPQSVTILIGPEGDFTPREIQSALNTGYLPITFGPIILRTETAALYALSILNYELVGTRNAE